MAKIKVKNTELNKLNKSILNVEKQIDNYYIEKEAIDCNLKELQKEIDTNNELISNFAQGKIPMDIQKYMNTKHGIVLLEKESKIKALRDLNGDFKGLEDALRDNVFNTHKDNVVNEYKDNRYDIINKMFCLMMEVTELSNQLNDESKKYYNYMQRTQHPKADYHRFEASLGMLWNRFIMNGFGIRYSQHVTSDILEFEEGYFNNLNK